MRGECSGLGRWAWASNTSASVGTTRSSNAPTPYHSPVIRGIPEPRNFTVGIGTAAQTKQRFRVGDTVSSAGEPVADPRLEVVDLHKAPGLKVEARAAGAAAPESNDSSRSSGGGGGNRTRVRRCSIRGFYTRSFPSFVVGRGAGKRARGRPARSLISLGVGRARRLASPLFAPNGPAGEGRPEESLRVRQRSRKQNRRWRLCFPAFCTR